MIPVPSFAEWKGGTVAYVLAVHAALHLAFPVSVSSLTPMNPYASGCLRAKLGSKEFPNHRVCNSDDDGYTDVGTAVLGCAKPDFDYPEIRIGAGNWETSIFQSYVLQIVLSEMVGVPATIESGSPDTLLSFYDEESRFPFPNRAYPYEDIIGKFLRRHVEFDGDKSRLLLFALIGASMSLHFLEWRFA